MTINTVIQELQRITNIAFTYREINLYRNTEKSTLLTIKYVCKINFKGTTYFITIYKQSHPKLKSGHILM